MSRIENVEIEGGRIESRSGFGIVRNGDIVLLIGGQL